MIYFVRTIFDRQVIICLDLMVYSSVTVQPCRRELSMRFAKCTAVSLNNYEKLKCSALNSYYYAVTGRQTTLRQTKHIVRTIFDKLFICLDLNMCLHISLVSLKYIIVGLHVNSRILSRLIFDSKKEKPEIITKLYSMHMLYGKLVNVVLYQVLCIPLKSSWLDVTVIFYWYLTAISHVAISLFQADDDNYISRYYCKRVWHSFPFKLFIVLCIRHLEYIVEVSGWTQVTKITGGEYFHQTTIDSNAIKIFFKTM